MTSLDLVNLPGSRLFHQVLAQPSRFFSRTTVDATFAVERSRHGASRKRLAELFAQGMGSIGLSDAQQANLDLFLNGQATAVCTGQQIGFLGGPFYTVLKIRSAVQAAADLARETSTPVVPVFWLEDNDHDAHEASTAVMQPTPTSTTSITHWDGTDDRLPVWRRQFSEHDRTSIAAAIDMLDGQHADAVKAQLARAYADTTSWADAFLNVLQPLLNAWGVLVIRGSHVIESGLHAPVLERDISGGGDLERAMEERTEALVSDGFHAQASVAEVSFFLHRDGHRLKIHRDGGAYRVGDDTLSADDLLSLARATPSTFSPSVLARPLVQDAVLPTIATVLGPGEIAYQAQITPAYQLAGIAQPVVLPRHQACILDQRTERNLSKSGRDAEWFFRPWEAVEREAADELQERANVPEVDPAVIHDLVLPWMQAATAVDPTLEKTVSAAEVSIQSSLEALSGKLRSAVKRKNGETLERLKGLWTSIYPESTMNERVFSFSLWNARLGADSVRIIAERICQQSRTSLTIIGASDIADGTTHA